MDSSARKKPLTMAEMLPFLSGISSKENMQTLTAKKKPRQTLASRTAEKILKPLTIAEMRADLQALVVRSPKRAQGATSIKKKWNSSIKVENKTVSHAAKGRIKQNSVRTLFNPQPKPKNNTISNARMTMMIAETPKLLKPEMKTRKTVHIKAHDSVRISGVFQIPETPLIKEPMKSRLIAANKENIPTNKKIIPNASVINKKIFETPKSCLRKKVVLSNIMDTPMSNESWKSSCDASFLQNEKDIEFIENKNKALIEEQTLENIAEVSPPVSTPFQEYRNVKEFFNNSSDVIDNSTALCQDDTIMCFDKTSISKENGKREESVIVSLCDMLNKATVSKPCIENISTNLNDLLELEKQTKVNLEMIENNIKSLISVKECELKSLQYVTKMINKRRKEMKSECESDKTVIEATKDISKNVVFTEANTKTPIAGKSCAVLKSCIKSPSYKIPKKSGLQKKVLYKSMPNVSNLSTPVKDMGERALSMYMKMKENMNFLSTPVIKQNDNYVPDTPAITSHNLQKQLDKLYSQS